MGRPKFQSPKQSARSYTDLSSPLRKPLCLSVKSQFSVASRVIRLLKSCTPPTIFGRVIAVIVDSIKSCSMRRLSHIGIEIFKRMPALGNFYSARSVIFKLRNVWIVTTANHGFPPLIDWRVCHTVPWLEFHGGTLIRNGTLK